MTSTGSPRVAPQAPGRLGYAIPAEALLPYLKELDEWRGERRRELDQLDAAALKASDSASYTSDLTLAMAIWQSVNERWESLQRLWDNGRADDRAREEMSRLIWGTAQQQPAGSAGAAPGGMGLSLVEATRLSDALTTSLRAKMAFDPAAADVVARIATVRAGLQRCLAARPAVGGPDLDALQRRLDSLSRTAAQGGDVTGPLGFLESDVARAERDLIVSAATHRELGRDFRAVLMRRAQLSALEDEIRELAARCAAEVTPIPRMAVPDVEALGKVPQSRAELDAFRGRLDQVERALAVVNQAFTRPLTERDDLRAQLGTVSAAITPALSNGAFGAVLDAARHRTEIVLGERPCQLPIARDLVRACELLLKAAQHHEPPPDQVVGGERHDEAQNEEGSQG